MRGTASAMREISRIADNVRDISWKSRNSIAEITTFPSFPADSEDFAIFRRAGNFNIPSGSSISLCLVALTRGKRRSRHDNHEEYV